MDAVTLPSRSTTAGRDLPGLFFMSGFAALIYQVAWQRLLFAGIGIDVVSVSIIVSTFMFGLGMGSLLGGFVADRRGRLVAWFAAIELAIGAFGVASPHVISAVTSHLASATVTTTALASLAVLTVPTILMGATLPILVIHANQSRGNIGVTTATLYMYNTLGAALGALFTGFYLFSECTLTQSTSIAAGINGLVAVSALLTERSAR